VLQGCRRLCGVLQEVVSCENTSAGRIFSVRRFFVLFLGGKFFGFIRQ
jgi:hypothetical protein